MTRILISVFAAGLLVVTGMLVYELKRPPHLKPAGSAPLTDVAAAPAPVAISPRESPWQRPQSVVATGDEPPRHRIVPPRSMLDPTHPPQWTEPGAMPPPPRPPDATPPSVAINPERGHHSNVE